MVDPWGFPLFWLVSLWRGEGQVDANQCCASKDDAVQKGAMIPLQDFAASPTSIYSKSWLPSPWHIINWGLRQIGLGNVYSGQKVKVGNLVMVANVEDVASKIVAEMQKRGSGLTDRVMALESFQKESNTILGVDNISSTDLSTLLRYLQRDKAVISYDGKVCAPTVFRRPILTLADHQIQVIFLQSA